jgi:predicted phosphoribosyltransferase
MAVAPPPYRDRHDAGIELAHRLDAFRGRSDVVVLALPRGGVPLAHEIASTLGAPLDIVLVRKLGLPNFPELAMGAIASGGVRILNDDVIKWYGVSPATVEAVTARELAELERREHNYRAGAPPVPLHGCTVILVDDGLATGSTMKAAVQAVRAQAPARVVVAVPVGSAEACREVMSIADDVVCVRTPDVFAAVGQWYRDFSQTSDAEVTDLLRHSLKFIHTRPITP